MPQVYLRKYGVQTTVDFELYETDGTDLKTDAVSASGDVTIYRDEAAEEQLDADAFTDEGKIYSLVLSATEMQAARITVCVVDQGTKTWLDKVFYVETYGNASAMHAFDLDTATQNVNVASIDNIDFGATMKTSLETAVDNGLDNAIGGAPTAGSVAERIKTLDDNYTATRAGYIDELAAANLPTDVANVKAETALIVADTNELQTDWKDGGRLDLIIDSLALEATVAALNDISADNVWDEVMDANAPANCNSAREIINVIASAVAGKCSGVDTDTPTFRDLGDTKNRLVTAIDANDNRTASTQDGT